MPDFQPDNETTSVGKNFRLSQLLADPAKWKAIQIATIERHIQGGVEGWLETEGIPTAQAAKPAGGSAP